MKWLYLKRQLRWLYKNIFKLYFDEKWEIRNDGEEKVVGGKER